MKTVILKSLSESQYCKGYFRNPNRMPIFGKFVAMKDHDELWAKGYVRFISRSRIEQFDIRKDTNPNVAINLTRVYFATDFDLVLLLDESKVPNVSEC